MKKSLCIIIIAFLVILAVFFGSYLFGGKFFFLKEETDVNVLLQTELKSKEIEATYIEKERDYSLLCVVSSYSSEQMIRREDNLNRWTVKDSNQEAKEQCWFTFEEAQGCISALEEYRIEKLVACGTIHCDYRTKSLLGATSQPYSISWYCFEYEEKEQTIFIATPPCTIIEI